MAENNTTPNPLEFQFGDLGSIVCTPSLTKKENYFFAGTVADEEGNRALVDLGDGDPLTVLNSLPSITVNGTVLTASTAAHLSKKTDRSKGGNPTITLSGSIAVDINGESKGYTVMANVTFLSETAKRPAGYTVNCKAIPQGEAKARKARGFSKGFALVTV